MLSESFLNRHLDTYKNPTEIPYNKVTLLRSDDGSESVIGYKYELNKKVILLNNLVYFDTKSLIRSFNQLSWLDDLPIEWGSPGIPAAPAIRDDITTEGSYDEVDISDESITEPRYSILSKPFQPHYKVVTKSNYIKLGNQYVKDGDSSYNIPINLFSSTVKFDVTYNNGLPEIVQTRWNDIIMVISYDKYGYMFRVLMINLKSRQDSISLQFFANEFDSLDTKNCVLVQDENNKLTIRYRLTSLNGQSTSDYLNLLLSSINPDSVKIEVTVEIEGAPSEVSAFIHQFADITHIQQNDRNILLYGNGKIEYKIDDISIIGTLYNGAKYGKEIIKFPIDSLFYHFYRDIPMSIPNGNSKTVTTHWFNNRQVTLSQYIKLLGILGDEILDVTRIGSRDISFIILGYLGIPIYHEYED